MESDLHTQQIGTRLLFLQIARCHRGEKEGVGGRKNCHPCFFPQTLAHLLKMETGTQIRCVKGWVRGNMGHMTKLQWHSELTFRVQRPNWAPSHCTREPSSNPLPPITYPKPPSGVLCLLCRGAITPLITPFLCLSAQPTRGIICIQCIKLPV